MNGMKVAYGGTEGAYAYIAAKRLFPGTQLISMSDFGQAYASVESGENDCAVIPIENSMAGDVGTVMDLMFSGSLYIRQIYDLPITHQLLGIKGTTKENIKTVISHPQALAQCGKYISGLKARTETAANTSAAARRVASEGDPTIAAIGSAETAEVFRHVVADQRAGLAADDPSAYVHLQPAVV